MNRSKPSLYAQRGVSLSGLIMLLAIICVVALFAMKVIPTYTEFLSAKEGIAAAKATNGSPAEARAAFYRHGDINNIRTIKGDDLVIEKVNGQMEVSFDYDNRVELFKNVSLIIRYAATTNPDGKIPERAEEEPTKKK